MIGMLRALARRRAALVALSDAQRALLALEAQVLRGRAGTLVSGARLTPRLALGGLATAAFTLLLFRRSGALRLASAALAVYPLLRRVLSLLRRR